MRFRLVPQSMTLDDLELLYAIARPSVCCTVSH